MSKWIDISDVLTEKGVEALKRGDEINLGSPEQPALIKVGNILKFRKDLSGQETHLKIVRIDRKRGKIWTVETLLVDPEVAEQEVNKMDLNRRQRRWIAKRGKK